MSIFGGDDFKLESSLRRLAAQLAASSGNGGAGAMRRQWLYLLQQCRQVSRCLHGSENLQSCDHIRHCTQLQSVVTRLSQVCKLAYNSGVQRAKHMCACCLANFLLHEPYQACQGPACQAWRHTHMLERRAKQAQQCALPSGFWGMPPPAPP